MRHSSTTDYRAGIPLIVAACVNGALALLTLLALVVLLWFYIDAGSPPGDEYTSVSMWAVVIGSGLALSVGYARGAFYRRAPPRWFWVLSGAYNVVALTSWGFLVASLDFLFLAFLPAWCGYMLALSAWEAYANRAAGIEAFDAFPA